MKATFALVLLVACTQPDLGSGQWAATAPASDADVVHDDASGPGSDGATDVIDAPVIDAADHGGYDAPMPAEDAAVPGADASTVGDASIPVDAPLVYDAPSDGPPTCTPESCGCGEPCPCALPPVREMIDIWPYRLDLEPGRYAWLSVTEQLSDGNVERIFDNDWTSDNSTVAFVYPNGYVYVNPIAVPGQIARLTVTTSDGSHSATLVLTVAHPLPVPAQGSNTPM